MRRSFGVAVFISSAFINPCLWELGRHKKPLRIAQFIGLRLPRLYPIYVAAILFLFVMVPARGHINTNSWQVGELPFHFQLLRAWADELTWNIPAWSISAEWAAYLA